jgi:hypothetical protein
VPDHTIATVSNRDERIRIDARPEGLSVEIRPFARTRRGRGWLAAVAVVVLAAALFGAAHLANAWEAGFRAGRFNELPLPVLIALTITVAVSTPLAFVGISALAFAEETISVGREEITITTAAFERVRIRRIRRPDLRGWKETYVPLSPWWTWAVKRLAARLDDGLVPIAGAAGPKDKRRIGIALAQATGLPLSDDFGRPISPSDTMRK